MPFFQHLLALLFMHNTWFGVWRLAGFIIAAFSYILSSSSPVYQVEMLCDLYAGFEPSQLSCLGSLVGKSVAWSWVRVPPEAANFYTVLGELDCVALPFCCVVVVALPFFQHVLALLFMLPSTPTILDCNSGRRPEMNWFTKTICATFSASGLERVAVENAWECNFRSSCAKSSTASLGP